MSLLGNKQQSPEAKAHTKRLTAKLTPVRAFWKNTGQPGQQLLTLGFFALIKRR
jgi:hypothetical protein